MQFVIEILLYVVFEVLAYFFGIIFLKLVGLGKYLDPDLKSERKWKWTSLYYRKNDRKYFTVAAVQIIGLVAIFLLVVLIVVVVNWVIR